MKRLLRALRGHSEEETLVSDITALLSRSVRWAGSDPCHAHTGWDVVRNVVAARSGDKAKTHLSSRQDDPAWFKGESCANLNTRND